MTHADLDRFVAAQEVHYSAALAEIRRGRKHSHWMWYVFPQVLGLGRSAMAIRYAIGSLEEAHAYVDHPVLGPRLRECVGALQNLKTSDAVQVFGKVDAVKLRSSLTLFAKAGGGALFEASLERWFGSPDPATLAILEAWRN